MKSIKYAFCDYLFNKLAVYQYKYINNIRGLISAYSMCNKLI